MNDNVVVRFAPSPTGYLHIGGARTALINWLFAKKTNGRFLIRIEDTDVTRSNAACSDAIINSMKWLNLDYDGDIVYQSNNHMRHINVARYLVDIGKAYYCNCSKERLADLRQTQLQNKSIQKYDGCCSQKQLKTGCIRLRVPQNSDSIVINDMIKGKVTVHSDTIDDMVLVRSDGTPTYMLSSVVDDHDMGITHIIRGDDHLTNAFRQSLIFKACDWKPPQYAHIPLIHGCDGTKLSKRHGAIGVHNFKDMGYLHDALIMYLYSLGFNYNINDTLDDVVKTFNIKKISKSSSRMDMKILDKINQKCMARMDANSFASVLLEYNSNVVIKAKDDVVQRCKTLVDVKYMLDNVYFPKSFNIPSDIDTVVQTFIKTTLINSIDKKSFDSISSLNTDIQTITHSHQQNLNTVWICLRWILTSQPNSPNICNIMYALGYDVCYKRITA